MPLEKDVSNSNGISDLSAPTCFKCDSVNQCTIGKPNKKLENC